MTLGHEIQLSTAIVCVREVRVFFFDSIFFFFFNFWGLVLKV